jgi:HK97 family phage portal protein
VGLVRDLSSNIFRVNADSGAAIAPISPHDDYWFTRPGYTSDSGMQVSPESALQLSAVYACVRIISETLASLPLIIYRRLPDGGKERATEHPLYEPLHDKPNIYQTSMEFIEMMQGHLELRGNAFARILPGPRGAVDQLIPLHPDRVNVFRLPNGRLRYQVREWYTGAVQNYAMEEIFHVRGLSSNGMVGMSPIAVQREVIGTALAQQEYAARFFANDSQPRGILQHPAKLSQEAYDRIKKSWQEAQTGGNRHKAALLEEGMEYKALSLNNVESQFMQARQYSRSDIAGFFRVPLHKIGDLSKSAFSNIEQQAIEFVTDCIRPRAVRWERRIACDLIEPLDLADGEEYFCEFLLDGLLRGDIKSRYAAYGIARLNGWFSVNDIRRKENENPIENGDEYLRPLNMVPVGTPGPDPVDEASIVTDDSPAESQLVQRRLVKAQLRAFAISAGERVVRKEVTALRKMLNRTNGDREKFDREALEFYSTHGSLISETMQLPVSEAEKYVSTNVETLKQSADRESTLALFEALCPEQLADLAIGAMR